MNLMPPSTQNPFWISSKVGTFYPHPPTTQMILRTQLVLELEETFVSKKDGQGGCGVADCDEMCSMEILVLVIFKKCIQVINEDYVEK